MNTAYLKRNESSKYGTFGTLSAPSVGFSCFTGEPPWKNNRSRVSCVPKGEYTVRIRQSPKYGTIFHLTNVEGRAFILMHWGNLCGDIEKGLKSHTAGCILLGQGRGWLSGQKAILNSRITVKKFMRLMNNEPFKLIIT
jgi:hypothetical protein